MKKCCHIVGARPQFIKYFPVFRATKEYNKKAKKNDVLQDILIHTGQHYDYAMSKIFFDEFGLKEPDYHLEVGSGTHGQQTGDILKHTEAVLQQIKPDIVIVYGDTNTTLGGALAAVKLHIPVAHVEAGLRSFNRHMPEEINRITTDHISSLLFCPSKTAVNNLKKEGFENFFNEGDLCDIHTFNSDNDKKFFNGSVPVVINSGDVMYDVFLDARKIAQRKSSILEKLKLQNKEFGLLTMHRAENTDDIKQFLELARFIRSYFKGKSIIFPVHPRIRKRVQQYKQDFGPDVIMLEPVSYFDLLMLLEACSFVLTDSGGLQKEAYWAKKPCVTLRNETEWVETLENGYNILMSDYKQINKFFANNNKLYGDGKAADLILRFLNNTI
ncbi:MAG: UDP-N-acetyl glucosamine 2-epimerase [bacterium]